MKYANKLALGASAAFLLTLGLPFASTYSTGEYVSGQLTIRGFNLVEFNAFGILPILIPLALIALVCCRSLKLSKIKMWSILLVLYVVGISASYIAASKWLTTTSSSTLDYGYGVVLNIVLAAAAFVFSFIAVSDHRQTDNVVNNA